MENETLSRNDEIGDEPFERMRKWGSEVCSRGGENWISFPVFISYYWDMHGENFFIYLLNHGLMAIGNVWRELG